MRLQSNVGEHQYLNCKKLEFVMTKFLGRGTLKYAARNFGQFGVILTAQIGPSLVISKQTGEISLLAF